MAFHFSGGIHPDDQKHATAGKPIELLKPPAQVVLPVSMHIGAPAVPVVKPGERVLMGQVVAQAEAKVCAPVHASVSGLVKEVAPRPHPNGTQVLSVVIDNDFEDQPHPDILPKAAPSMSQAEIVQAVREGGVVGHGGAMFPTAIKLESGVDKVDTLLINGAECEPYLTSDHRILLELPWEVVGGIQILISFFRVNKAYLCVENNKRDAFSVIKSHLPTTNNIALTPLRTKYPQGAEKQLIAAVTGREVPSGKLPADVGCAVFNVDTAAAIYRLFHLGMPVIRRVVTVSGSAVSNPKNLEVRIGTPVGELIDACGGFLSPPDKLLMGGPMMGTALSNADVPVIKGTNGILAFCRREGAGVKHPACIRCGKCASVCPMRLIPTYLYQASEKNDLAACEQYKAHDCIECGSCAYICPGKLPLTQGIRVAKQRVLSARRK